MSLWLGTLPHLQPHSYPFSGGLSSCHQAPQLGQGNKACLRDGGQVGVDIVQGVVDIGEGTTHSLGEAGVADESTDITSPTREGQQGQSSVLMLLPRTLQIHPHQLPAGGSGAERWAPLPEQRLPSKCVHTARGPERRDTGN